MYLLATRLLLAALAALVAHGLLLSWGSCLGLLLVAVDHLAGAHHAVHSTVRHSASSAHGHACNCEHMRHDEDRLCLMAQWRLDGCHELGPDQVRVSTRKRDTEVQGQGHKSVHTLATPMASEAVHAKGMLTCCNFSGSWARSYLLDSALSSTTQSAT